MSTFTTSAPLELEEPDDDELPLEEEDELDELLLDDDELELLEEELEEELDDEEDELEDDEELELEDELLLEEELELLDEELDEPPPTFVVTAIEEISNVFAAPLVPPVPFTPIAKPSNDAGTAVKLVPVAVAVCV
jgi:hypothetical protein